MKTWSIPQAAVQQFIPSDYVSACYNIKCMPPNNDKKYSYLYADSNGNGIFEPGIDELLLDASSRSNQEHSWNSCGRHKVIIQGGLPSYNGFIAPENDPTAAVPYFYWYGNVIDVTRSGNPSQGDIHGTDLNHPNALIPSPGNFS